MELLALKENRELVKIKKMKIRILLSLCCLLSFKGGICQSRNKVDVGLRDSIFDHELYNRKLVKSNGVGMRWSVEDDKKLVKVESYNTIMKHFDTSLLLKPVFAFKANGKAVLKKILFQEKQIVLSKGICFDGYVLTYGRTARNDRRQEKYYSNYSIDFGEFRKAEPVGIHFEYDPDKPNVLLRKHNDFSSPMYLLTDTLYRKDK